VLPARHLLGPEATQYDRDVGRVRLAVLDRPYERVRDLGARVQGEVREDGVDVDREELAHPRLEGLQEGPPIGERRQEAALVTRARILVIVPADRRVVLGIDDQLPFALGQPVAGDQLRFHWLLRRRRRQGRACPVAVRGS